MYNEIFILTYEHLYLLFSMFFNTVSVHIPSLNLAEKANNTNNSFLLLLLCVIGNFHKEGGGIKVKYL